MLDIINNDFRIYDEKPGEGYITGYVIQVNINYHTTALARLSAIIHDELVNMYAYIPTNLPASTEDPSVVVWLIFATKFERTLGVWKLENKRANFKKMQYSIPTKKRVWFHESWVLNSYDPTKYDTDAKKYAKLKTKSSVLTTYFSAEESLKWRKAYFKEKPCYKATDENNETCRNARHQYGKPCMRCPVSISADRYDRTGKCIIKCDGKRRRRKKSEL